MTNKTLSYFYLLSNRRLLTFMACVALVTLFLCILLYEAVILHRT